MIIHHHEISETWEIKGKLFYSHEIYKKQIVRQFILYIDAYGNKWYDKREEIFKERGKPRIFPDNISKKIV